MNFRAHLAEQLEFIRSSCVGYDAGHVREAVRVATHLRILFHQTKSSTSLINHLGIKSLRLLSTCDKPNPGTAFFPGMTRIAISVEERLFQYEPKLKTHYEHEIPFNDWWFREVVYLARVPDLKITRKDLVLGAANRDGGAHIDSTLEPRYEQVLSGAGARLIINMPGESQTEIACQHGHLAAIRQMGYEVLNSPQLLEILD